MCLLSYHANDSRAVQFVTMHDLMAHALFPMPQCDMFGSTFSLASAGAADLPKDILIPGE